MKYPKKKNGLDSLIGQYQFFVRNEIKIRWMGASSQPETNLIAWRAHGEENYAPSLKMWVSMRTNRGTAPQLVGSGQERYETNYRLAVAVCGGVSSI
jgi:hypothetical protein